MLQVMTLGIGLISTPLLLSWLGNDRCGAFRAAIDWGNYLNLLELGIGGSLLTLLAKAVGIGDHQQIWLTLAAGIRTYLDIMGLWAALADLHAKGEIDKFNARVIELTRLVAVMGLALMVAIAAYNPYFVKLWVGQERFAGDAVTLLAACNGFLLGLLSLWGWCFSGTGNVGKITLLSALTAVINVIISIVSTHFFGIIGPLLLLSRASLHNWRGCWRC
ncbi:hypothetical protein [Nostoc sp.]|uniref:hypothetical protein n=1 Tax=Nostoc sp. TaxID=1180 RepID=UPI002FF8DC71